MPKKKKPKPTDSNRLTQIKVTIPKTYQESVKEAMAYDGATKSAAFALAAILQRTRRILAQKALELKKPEP